MENDSITLLILLNKSQGVYMENIDTQTFYKKKFQKCKKTLIYFSNKIIKSLKIIEKKNNY